MSLLAVTSVVDPNSNKALTDSVAMVPCETVVNTAAANLSMGAGSSSTLDGGRIEGAAPHPKIGEVAMRTLAPSALTAARGSVNWRGVPFSQTLKAHNDEVYALRILNNGTLASISELSAVRLWDPNTLMELTDRTVVSLCENMVKIVGPDGKCIDVLSLDRGFHSKFVRLKKGGFVRMQDQQNYFEFWSREGVYGKLSPCKAKKVSAFLEREDGSILIGTTDGIINVCDSDCESRRTRAGHTGAVNDLVGLSDGSWVSAGNDGLIREWKNGICVRSYLGHTDCVTKVVELDPETLASASDDGTVRIWDRRGTCLHTLRGHPEAVNTLVKMKDGTLVSLSHHEIFGSMIKVWNNRGECLHTIVEDPQEIRNLTEVSEGTLAGSIHRCRWETVRCGDIKFWTFPTFN